MYLDSLNSSVKYIYRNSQSNAARFHENIINEGQAVRTVSMIFIILALLYGIILTYITKTQVSNPLKKVINEIAGFYKFTGRKEIDVNKGNEVYILNSVVSKMENLTEELSKENNERKIAESKLITANELLLKTVSDKEKVFSIIAHDLRNPFHAILGFSEFLKDNLETISSREIMDILDNVYLSAQKQFNLLQNLLNWSRAQLGEIKVNKELFELHPHINEIINQEWMRKCWEDCLMIIQLQEERELQVNSEQVLD